MKKTLQISALPEDVGNDELLKNYISRNFHIAANEILGIHFIKKSVDARRKPIKINLELEVFINETPTKDKFKFDFKNVSNAKEITIIGAGPAGLFAALKLIELGLKPVIFERGKNVKERRRDLVEITKKNSVNPDSNYCFGEGGAGTYSDGKLYTRSSKRGDVKRILNLLVYHGADENILYESHPHIGTNKLPGIIENIRKTILDCGGEIHFNSKLTDIEIENDKIKKITIVENGIQHLTFNIQQLILATGHSARDIFELLHARNILIESKPFALGVRIEHPQELIDKIQYKCKDTRTEYLPASSYNLVQQINGKGVFSFCMCPGGIIAPSMTNPGEIVLNGWSPSKRNNPFANSGIVVSVEQKELIDFEKYGPLAALNFQKSVEQKCFEIGDGTLKAPAQLVQDFIDNKKSQHLIKTSYLPGTNNVKLDEVLPMFISTNLRQALKEFGKKMKDYCSNEAILLATESRTSSPVRIPRNKDTFEHPQIKGFYPCAEGAGYAGGIMSAAMDGENCAMAISTNN